MSGYEDLITSVFNETMKLENNDRFYEVSVVYVSKERIKEINYEYREINQVTDVISFALFDETEESDIIQDESNITTLGDIFICIEKMKEQSIEYGHSEKRELAFLACHGLLHLLGYDHLNQTDEAIMFKKQEDILNALDLKRQ
ncbi:rRNA maturation RNase YbeY [Mycoplasmatota bacterium]|nr:rRNA maturation RNase YbeY [Mycoplasmatota bacterium]